MIAISEKERKILSLYISLPNKEATVKEIQIMLDYATPGEVNLDIVRIAKKIAPVFSYVPRVREKGTKMWWPCLFEGRKEKRGFVYSLRREVEEWYKQNYHEEDLFERVRFSLQDPDARKERLRHAQSKPEKIVVETVAFERNPDVVAEALENANGICQHCKMPAPFNRRSDGTPYLEVHHKVPLSEGGDDTVANAVALCPNCHRKAHFG